MTHLQNPCRSGGIQGFNRTHPILDTKNSRPMFRRTGMYSSFWMYSGLALYTRNQMWKLKSHLLMTAMT